MHRRKWTLTVRLLEFDVWACYFNSSHVLHGSTVTARCRAGEVHDCLRAHRSALSEECALEEGKLEVLQAESVELQPGLARDCAAERRQHCGDVQPGQSRVANCLIANGRLVRIRLTSNQDPKAMYASVPDPPEGL